MLESGPRASGRDEAGHPATIAATTVSEPRVDADFADEHVDGGHQVGVQFLGPYLAYAGVDSAAGVSSQGHQRLVVADIPRRTPHRLEPLPHRQHQVGPADQ